MKDRLMDVMKWGLIIVIAGVVTYAVYPKYECFRGAHAVLNKITGKVYFGDAVNTAKD